MSNSNAIEKTILECAKYQLEELRGYVGLGGNDKDSEEAVASFNRVSALAELALVAGNGLSTETKDGLSVIYREAAGTLAILRQ